MAGPIRIAILGDASSGVRAIKTTETASSRLSTRLRSVATAAARAAAAGAALGAGFAIYAGLNFAEAAANDAQQAAILARTLTQAAGANKAGVAAAEDWITAQGKALGIADDDLRPALGKLAVATGSVAEAQRLASLAADVAAGRNKDLGTVTEALAKAQAGNLGGLGRLGVATKDAAGNTKSLEAITADLAKTYRGAASTAANSAAGKYERVKLALSETAESLGYRLLPLLTEVGNFLLDKGIPAAEQFADAAGDYLGPKIQDLSKWLKANRDDLADLGRQITGTVVPAIETTVGVLGDLVGLFLDLPDPVRKFGLEAAAAALLLPRLTAAASATSTGLTGFVGNVRNAETRVGALKGAIGQAAGVAGMVALADGAQRSSGGLKTLENVAGGAAAGFAIGGPWGAAIGGAGGLLLTLAQSTDKTTESFKFASPEAGNYADQLNRVSGAATAATRNTAALALQQSGAIEAGRNLGLSSRDLVKYVLGNADAVGKVERAIRRASREQVTWTDQYGATHTVLAGTSADAIKLNTALGRNADAYGKAKAQAQELSLANGSLSKALKGVDDRSKIIAKIEQQGFPETTADLAKIIGKQDLARKDVKTLIKALGVDTTVNDVQRVIDRLAGVRDKTVTVTVVTKNQRGGVTSSSGGRSSEDPIGNPRKAGQSTAEKYLEGLIDALSGGTDQVSNGLDKLLGFIDKTYSKRLASIRKTLDKTLDGKALDKAVDKAEKRLEAQQRKTLKRTAEQRAAVRALGEQQDALQSGDYLKYLDHASDLYKRMTAAGVHNLAEARQALQSLQDQAASYAATIKAAFVDFGNVVSLGEGAGFENASQLVDLLKDKVAQAQQYASLIAALRQQGLNETAIQQLIDAGVQGGLGTAQAILAGGPEAIGQINALQAQLAAAGQTLGQQSADALYSAGINAAQGLVDGLAAQADALAAQATKLAKALVRAVKKALGINSPSTVFRGLGKFAVQGLNLGLDEDYVRRQGLALSRSLEQGFGSPELGAYLAARAENNKTSVEVRLTAQQLDAIARGKAVQADLDAYYANGGRRSA